MDSLRQQLDLAREFLPHENPQLLEMLLYRGLVLDEIVELLLILPPDQKMMLLLGDTFGGNKDAGRSEEELRKKKDEETVAEILFQPTDLDEQLVYGAAWKVGKKTKKTAAQSGGGVIQGDLDSDSDDSDEDASEMMNLYSDYNDQWIEPQGDLSHWYTRQRFYKDGGEVPKQPRSPKKQPPAFPKTDEIQLWAHDWEEQSDDEELLSAKERLVDYSGIFEKGKYMEVGRELRRDQKTFNREKKEVLRRIAKTIKQQVEYHGTTEPAEERQDGFGVDDTTVTILEPKRSYTDICCYKCLCFLDSPIRFSDINIPTKTATWTLPKNNKKKQGMHLHIRNAHLAIHPFHWRWRALEMCCCGIGPWACLDSGATSISAHLDLLIDFDTNLHPSPPPDLPVVNIKKVKVNFTDITPTTNQSQGCCSCEPPTLDKEFIKTKDWKEPPKSWGVRGWSIAPPTCCLNCIPQMLSCCILPTANEELENIIRGSAEVESMS
eukprot:TRINITY_DN8298_c0_g1_i7.p1 TRINITY_DN8298_c0_g1~~TRINITY_DN8298_c0_g1_i7.p1  ORF type:complete len:492 (+),score=102.44 TRINITY_DN8298_c0_g1_i7:55-1530(+)